MINSNCSVHSIFDCSPYYSFVKNVIILAIPFRDYSLAGMGMFDILADFWLQMYNNLHMAVFDQDIIGNFIAFFSGISRAIQSKWWYVIEENNQIIK